MFLLLLRAPRLGDGLEHRALPLLLLLLLAAARASVTGGRARGRRSHRREEEDGFLRARARFFLRSGAGSGARNKRLARPWS